MPFNFAHLLSAACGGAPRRLGRLRRPWARCARLFWGLGGLYTSTEKWPFFFGIRASEVNLEDFFLFYKRCRCGAGVGRAPLRGS